MQDGAVATAAMDFSEVQNKFVAFDKFGTPLAIRYAGAAPGLIDGVFQMNLQAPLAFNGPFAVQAKDAFGVALCSNPVQLYVR